MRNLRLTCVFVLSLVCLATAQPADEKALSALRDGVPQTAIAPLREAVRRAPSATEKNRLGLLLARTQLAAGRPDDAIATLDGPCDRGSSEAVVLRASALAAQGELEAAAKLAGAQMTNNPEAALLLARIRWTQGNLEEARELLSTSDGVPADPWQLRLLLDLQLETDPASAEPTIAAAREKKLLPDAELDTALGRVRLAQDKPSEASELFRQALGAEQIPSQVRDNARLGLARSLVAFGVENRASEVLLEGLSTAPDALTTRESMDEWIRLERAAGGDPEPTLRRWTNAGPSRRTFEARLHAARLQLEGKTPDAALADLVKLSGEAQLGPEEKKRVGLLLAEAQIAAGRPGEALQTLLTLGETGGKTETFKLAELQGRALAATGQYRQAYEAFGRALAAAQNPQQSGAAAANRLLCALALGDLAMAEKSFEELRTLSPTDPDLARWSFLLAAAEARRGNPDSLAALSRSSPAAEYAFLSKLALAEWQLSRGETAAAGRMLKTAQDDDNAGNQAAALAAAEIFTGDVSGSRSREDLIAACTDFLARFPDDVAATDVAFKLGELQARGGDHAAAESTYTDLATRIKEPELAALATFLAAQSAARSMSAEGTSRALVWYDQVAQSKSDLRYRARLEQASLLLRDKKFEDALTLYDRLLSDTPPTEVRLAAMMEKGDTLFAVGAEDPSKLPAAAETYAALAADADAPADWRDQAACKHANTLAKAGQSEAALAVFHEVLSRAPEKGADHFWFYKAGLEAGRLLEDQQNWSEAIAIYDRLASVQGPQREELAQRARRLRLEHFIWEN